MEIGLVKVERALERAQAAGVERAITKLASGERRDAKGNQSNVRLRSLMQETASPASAERRLERILAGNELTDVSYLTRGALVARSVGRVVVRRHDRVIGYGTGFLVAPGVLMTNNHVLASADDVRDSLVQFRYETDVQGNDLDPVSFALSLDPAPILVPELDFTLAAVARQTGSATIDDFGWIRLNPEPGKAFVGEYLTIIQHPRGERKQVCVRENKLLKYDAQGPYVWYQTDTVGGSSGSPAFNNSWDAVALHHSGVPKTTVVDGKQVWLNKNGRPWKSEEGEEAVEWIANEGIRISQILAHLAATSAASPLVQAVFNAPETPFNLGVSAGAAPAYRPTADRVDSAPVEISIRIGADSVPIVATHAPAINAGQPALPAQPSPALPPGPPPSIAMPAPVAVEIDTTNYDKRTGYDPTFLGKGAVVDLPTITQRVDEILEVDGDPVLKYWTYSVVMNASRGLAFYSAANVDSVSLGEANRKGDPWTRDRRVDAVDSNAQIGKEFYDKQATFESAIERPLNPFDQGHLTRWKDTHWGANAKQQKRNGDDSFHYTNCAPQHFEFNQNRKTSGIWFRLEEQATQFGDGTRISIFNGPVFDAPVSTLENGTLVLDPEGVRKPDKQFGGRKIPKQFFKVIAYKRGKALRAAAFVVSQERLLDAIDRLEAVGLTETEIDLYQVTLKTLKSLTGLDFGDLAKAEEQLNESVSVERVSRLPLANLTDAVF